MAKAQSPFLQLLYKLEIGQFVTFRDENKSMVVNSIRSFRANESRRNTYRLIDIKGNKITRTK